MLKKPGAAHKSTIISLDLTSRSKGGKKETISYLVIIPELFILLTSSNTLLFFS